jgi:hypothetical protein
MTTFTFGAERAGSFGTERAGEPRQAILLRIWAERSAGIRHRTSPRSASGHSVADLGGTLCQDPPQSEPAAGPKARS